MNKLLAIIRREYLQRVRSRMFILMTVLAPVVISLFGIAPALIFSIRAGGPVRVAVLDQTGRMYSSVYNAVMEEAEEANSTVRPVDQAGSHENSSERFETMGGQRKEIPELQQVPIGGRSLGELKAELERRVGAKEIDGYLILPPNFLDKGAAELVTRNTGDVLTRRFLQQALSRAVRQQRLIDANINAKTVQALSRPVELEASKVGATDGKRDSGEAFALVFGVGFVMYLTILLYGQVILGAVIEEKESRIAEILFSSAKPFSIMLGKLIGVFLVALTQLTIWGLALVAFTLYGVGVLAARGMPLHVPAIPASYFLYFALFFLMGYFIYSTIYALVGSIVTNAQEGAQLAMPVILLLVIGFYLFLPVSRSPDSSFAFWVSMVPFFSPITMPVRIVTQTPPFWEILLSLSLGFGAIALLTGLAARVYRVGMLMSGKKPTIPEIVRWVRQS
ncbi:MAG: ABC transporter permease [Pyrinomonadaceae bacterium]